jgi:hypothetical protein
LWIFFLTLCLLFLSLYLCRFDLLLEDLTKYFSTALSQVQLVPNGNSQKVVHEEHDSDDEQGEGDEGSTHNPISQSTKTNRDIPAFRQGKELSTRLTRVSDDF